MDEEKSIELKNLVGKHLLYGVDESTMKIQKWDDSYEDCQCINFVLDGVTYTALEDPNDGYRSMLDKIYVSGEKVSNNFEPVEVIIIYREKSDCGYDCEILDFIDTKNGKRVLEVGTDNSDDYYPSFVASWTPENLSVNETK